MLPRPPAIVGCSGCGRCFWLADAPELKGSPWFSQEWISDDRERQKLPLLKVPQQQMLDAAIADGLGHTDE
jgi:hypothetical protein